MNADIYLALTSVIWRIELPTIAEDAMEDAYDVDEPPDDVVLFAVPVLVGFIPDVSSEATSLI